ncbi:MAG: DUF4388 domain-containing protein [Actinomycetota bacterium]
MGLQGTIDTLPVSDVLGLLCAVGQHGVLEVRGGATRASLSLEAGDLVGGDIDGLVAAPADRAALVLRLVDVLTGALWIEQGGYTFRPGRAEAAAVGRVPLDEVLDRARAAADAWASVAATVPSFDAVPFLVDGGSDDESLTLHRSALRLVAAIDGRRTVAEVGGLCERSAAEAAVPLAGLVARGVVEIRLGAPEVSPAALEVAPAPIVEEVAREQAALAARLVEHRAPETDAASRALADLAGLDAVGSGPEPSGPAGSIGTEVSPEAEHLVAVAAESGHEGGVAPVAAGTEQTTITADRGALLRLFSGLRAENS